MAFMKLHNAQDDSDGGSSSSSDVDAVIAAAAVKAAAATRRQRGGASASRWRVGGSTRSGLWYDDYAPMRSQELVMDAASSDTCARLRTAVQTALATRRRGTPAPCLLLGGPTGSGKSSVVRALAHELGSTAVFIDLVPPLTVVEDCGGGGGGAAGEGSGVTAAARRRRRAVLTQLRQAIRFDHAGPPWRTVYVVDGVETLTTAEWGCLRTGLVSNSRVRACVGLVLLVATTPFSDRLPASLVPWAQRFVLQAPSDAVVVRVVSRAAAAAAGGGGGGGGGGAMEEEEEEEAQRSNGDLRQALLRAQLRASGMREDCTSSADVRALHPVDATKRWLQSGVADAAAAAALGIDTIGSFAPLWVFGNLYKCAPAAMGAEVLSAVAEELSLVDTLPWTTQIAASVRGCVLRSAVATVHAASGDATVRVPNKLVFPSHVLRRNRGGSLHELRMKLMSACDRACVALLQAAGSKETTLWHTDEVSGVTWWELPAGAQDAMRDAWAHCVAAWSGGAAYALDASAVAL